MRFIAAAAALLLACSPTPPERMARIVSAGPPSGVAPDAAVAEVRFSEPVDPAGIADGRFFALVRSEDLREATKLVEEPGGLLPGAPVVAGAAELAEEGRCARLRPAAPLEARAGYAVLVGTRVRSADGRLVLDPEGRRRVFAWTFETGDTPDRIAPAPRWIVPPHGPVARNLRTLRVGFGEPVSGSLELPAGAGRARPAPAGPGELALAMEGLLAPGRLAPVLARVRDAAGNAAAGLEPIEVRDCVDRLPPVPDEAGAAVVAGETTLELSAPLSEMARLGMEIAAPAGEGACGAVPAPPETLVRWGEVGPCPGHDPSSAAPRRCEGRIAALGLCPGRRLRLRLLAEDLAGIRAVPGAWRDVATAAPLPRPVLTEVRVDADAPEAGGEFAELANLGTGDAELGGHSLAKRTASGATSRCALEPLGGPIPPGGHGLVVGGAYDGRYRLPEGTPLFRCGATALLGGLADDHPPALLLEGPDGAVLSSLGLASAPPRCTGRSVERIHPAAPDAAANLACAPAPPGTPGACNGSTPAAECPRRPW